MTHPDHDITALVEQCDREAAIKAGEEALRNVQSLKDYDHGAMVRHFARHRLAALEAQQAALAVKDSEIERLRARLEVPASPFEAYDGIDCRDETIRLLDARVAALQAENERLREANGILEDALQEVGDDYPGSSCQEWCRHQVKAARAALGDVKP